MPQLLHLQSGDRLQNEVDRKEVLKASPTEASSDKCSLFLSSACSFPYQGASIQEAPG